MTCQMCGSKELPLHVIDICADTLRTERDKLLLQIDEKRRALKQCEDENSELMKKIIRFKAALEDEQSSRASLIDALNTELRDSLPQSEQADVGSDLRYYLRLLVDQVRAQERKQTEKRNGPKGCICGPEGRCDYHAMTDVTTPINQQCWCAAKAEAKDAKCPIHD